MVEENTKQPGQPQEAPKKTATDLLLDIIESLDKIHSRIDILEKTAADSNFNQKLVMQRLKDLSVTKKDAKVNEIPATYTKRVPVTQHVRTSSGKDINLAQVKIFRSGLEYKTTKTNIQGKWAESLEIGSYSISIERPASANKPPVNLKTTFEVSSTDKPIELPELISQ